MTGRLPWKLSTRDHVKVWIRYQLWKYNRPSQIAAEYNISTAYVVRIGTNRTQMPTPPPEWPITKCTLNLFSHDLADLRRWEENWSTKVRELIHSYCQEKRRDKTE